MKKILYVFGSLQRAGAQLRTLEVCRELRRQHEVQFDFCNLGRYRVEIQPEIDEVGGKIYHVPMRSRHFIPSFSDLLRKEEYDIVDSRPLLWNGVILYLARVNKTPVRIASIRNSLSKEDSNPFGPVLVWLMRRLIRHSATHIVAVSHASLNTVLPARMRPPGKCRVIYNGIPQEPFRPEGERRQVREAFGWPDRARIVINVARFYPQKNHKTILKVARLAHERSEDVRLLLVGDGPLAGEISRSIEQDGLGGFCVMAGLRNDVPRLLLASDAFLFPSLSEGLGGALLEAMAAGLPAVASDIPSIREIAEHFPAFIQMAPATDVERQAEQILLALASPPDRLAAQKHFSQTPFTLERCARDYASLYGLRSSHDKE